MSASNISQVLTSLGQTLAEDAMVVVNPAISSVMGDMIGNPKDWSDPATAVVKGAAAVATIVAGVSNPLEAAAIAGAAQLVSSLWQMLKPHLSTANSQAVKVEYATASIQTSPQVVPATATFFPAGLSTPTPSIDASHM